MKKAELEIPEFASESEEAEWWPRQEDHLAEHLEEAIAGGTVERNALVNWFKEKTAITLELAEGDIRHAKKLAESSGADYKTFLENLVHEALDKETRKAS